MPASRLLVIVLIASATLPAFAGQLYKWTDPNGIVHYSDSPVTGQPALQLDSPDSNGNAARQNPKNSPPGSAAVPAPSPGAEPPSASGPKQYEIPYVPNEGSAKRIIVKATFNGTTTASIAIDTGSPDTVISFDLAKRLGLLSPDAAQLWTIAGGIGGEVPALSTIIDTISIGGAEQRFFVTTVTDSLSSAFDGVVGMDFLVSYSTRVDPTRHLLILQELPPGAERYGGHDEDWWRSQFRSLAFVRKQWKEAGPQYEEEISRSGIEPIEAKEVEEFDDQQYEEANKMFDTLNHYASELSVPMSWRAF